MEMLRAAGSRKVVGTKQVLRAIGAGTVSRVYVGSDAVDVPTAAAGLLR